MEQVILVDEHDHETGIMEKMEAHEKGLLHRAFSVLIFNSKGEMLLQRRANSKYHSGGLWTNTCCSHPQPGETMVQAAQRKLFQEMGIVCDLIYSHKFIYKAHLNNNLIEHEYDQVLIGYFDGSPAINEQEAQAFKFESPEVIKMDAEQNPAAYTSWFKLMLRQPEFQSILQHKSSNS